MSHTD